MIRGSIAALVTPMHASGALDLTALDRLVDLHLREGTHGLVAVGTTGESATLDHDEHLAVIRRVVARVAGRIPVIAGTGSNCTREAIELTQAAKQAGADACLLVTPYYVRPTQQGLVRHFQLIADSVDIPQILYNVPARTGCDLETASVAALCGHPNIVGIKDATGDLARAAQLLALAGRDFAVYSGDDPTALELLRLGGAGNISVVANLLPGAMARLCSAALAGDMDLARELDAAMQGLYCALFRESNPIPCKWALHERGLMDKGIRLPLLPLSNAERQPLMRALAQAEQAVRDLLPGVPATLARLQPTDIELRLSEVTR